MSSRRYFLRSVLVLPSALASASAYAHIQNETEEVGITASALKTFAIVNRSRLRAGLAPLALHPGLMKAATEIATDKAGRATQNSIPAPNINLVRNSCLRYYGSNDCKVGGFARSGKPTPGSTADNMIHSSEYGDAPFISDPDLKTVGIAIATGVGFGNAMWSYCVTLYGRQEPDAGCMIPVSLGHEDDNKPGKMVFPVLKGANWSDTFGQPREGHKHEGQDLLAPKMRPLVACFDGTVSPILDKTSKGNSIHLDGDNGWRAVYMHLNCDTPGTHDGNGGKKFAFAPGLEYGDSVRAGQFIGYVGDSGNARGGPCHCHFELYNLKKSLVNSAPYLKTAANIANALPNLTEVERRAYASRLTMAGEIQLNGVVTQVEAGSTTIAADSFALLSKETTKFDAPRNKMLVLPDKSPTAAYLKKGTQISVVGTDSGLGKPLILRLLLIRV